MTNAKTNFTLDRLTFDDQSIIEFRNDILSLFGDSFKYDYYGDSGLSAYSFSFQYGANNYTDVFDIILYLIETLTESLWQSDGKGNLVQTKNGDMIIENLTRARYYAGTGENIDY